MAVWKKVLTEVDKGISNGNVLTANATVDDNDFLRINGTVVEGRTAANVLSDIGAYASSNPSSYAADQNISGIATNATAISSLDTAKAPKAGPTFSGTVAIPNYADVESTLDNIAGNATAIGLRATLASPTLTGTPAAPTASTATDTTQIATTAYVKAQGYTGATDITSKANIASQAFTGTPSFPTGTTGVTQTSGNSTTRLATTAFVQSATSAGDLTSIVAGAGMTGSSLTGPIPTLNVVGGTGIKANADDMALDLTEVPDQTAQIDSTDELIMLNGGVTQGRKRFAEINLGQFVNDQSWTSNSGTTTASNSQTFTNKGGNISQWTNNSSYVTSSGVTGVTATGPVASTGGSTPVISMAAGTDSAAGYITAASHTNITGTKAVAAANTTAIALNTTHRGVTGGVHAVGTVTSVSAGTAIDISGTATTTPTVNVDLSELTSHTIGNGAGTITISGDLVVTGDTTTVNTEEILLADNNIVLNHGNAGAGADGGITIDRGSETDMKLYWNEAKDTWFAQNGTTPSGGARMMLQTFASGVPATSNNGPGLGQFYVNSSTYDLYIRTG